MEFNLQNKQARIFVPDEKTPKFASDRTTVLCFAAHQDDTEIMAYNAIADGYDSSENWITSVVVTDGASSPRVDVYSDYTDEQMIKVRMDEQNKAAQIGKYSIQIQLCYTSEKVKDVNQIDLLEDIKEIIKVCCPDIVYTHNLADKHDTHVAVALRTINAIRELPEEHRPKKIYGMEVWRSLDWLLDKDKSIFDASAYPDVATALLRVFDSQICGGKRYDLATIGRRTANATFFEAHDVDTLQSAIVGIDMTELIKEDSMGSQKFITKNIDNFKNDVISRLNRMGGKQQT